jgi:hypothetical protein
MCCVKERALTSYRFLEHCRCGCLLGIIQIVLDNIQLIAQVKYKQIQNLPQYAGQW